MNNEKIRIEEIKNSAQAKQYDKQIIKEIFNNARFFKIAKSDFRKTNKESIQARILFLKSYKANNFALKCWDIKNFHFAFLKAQSRQMAKFNNALIVEKEIKYLTRLNNKLFN